MHTSTQRTSKLTAIAAVLALTGPGVGQEKLSDTDIVFKWAVGRIMGKDHEGGLTENPLDPANSNGRATNFGITQPAYDSWCCSKGIQTKDVRGITRNDASKVYYDDYWKRNGCDEISKVSVGLAYLIFDSCINNGPRLPIDCMQACLGVKQDGCVGPETIKALSQLSKTALEEIVARVTAARMEIANRPHYARHFRGLKRRYQRVCNVALKGIEVKADGTNLDKVVQDSNTGPVQTPMTERQVLSAISAKVSSGSYLSSGSMGPEVKGLQEILNRILPSQEISADGVFGKATRQKLIEFQIRNNLRGDGVLGPKTLEVLSRY